MLKRASALKCFIRIFVRALKKKREREIESQLQKLKAGLITDWIEHSHQATSYNSSAMINANTIKMNKHKKNHPVLKKIGLTRKNILYMNFPICIQIRGKKKRFLATFQHSYQHFYKKRLRNILYFIVNFTLARQVKWMQCLIIFRNIHSPGRGWG